ncbi:MAG: SlyX family protein [Phycisphaerales bacterium]|nr:SlyX family protein [Phycisphaerales bacterium]
MDGTIEARLTALEESASFQQRTVEQLDEEVRRAWRQVELLRRRLSVLERRLDTLPDDRAAADDEPAE